MSIHWHGNLAWKAVCIFGVVRPVISTHKTDIQNISSFVCGPQKAVGVRETVSPPSSEGTGSFLFLEWEKNHPVFSHGQQYVIFALLLDSNNCYQAKIILIQ